MKYDFMSISELLLQCLLGQRCFSPGRPVSGGEQVLSRFPSGLEHCAIIATTIITSTVIIGLVLSLERADGQGGCVARPGARESVGDP